jgi:hypothetical protein
MEVKVNFPAKRSNLFYRTFGRIVRTKFKLDGECSPADDSNERQMRDAGSSEGSELAMDLVYLVKSKYIDAKSFRIMIPKRMPSQFYRAFGKTLEDAFSDESEDKDTDEAHYSVALYHALEFSDIFMFNHSRKLYNMTTTF